MAATLPPSIFNDVLGPVMRGPSSSHSAASVRIGRIARDLCGGDPDRVLVEFDTEGSLATTHESQGSDMGLFGGLLGWEADDARLPSSATALKEVGVALEIRIARLDDPHPNTYRLKLWKGEREHSLVAISTGGGMIEVIQIDGFPVSLYGDYVVTLVPLAEAGPEVARSLEATGSFDRVECVGDGPHLLVLSGQEPAPPEALEAAGAASDGVRHLDRVLPVGSRRDLAVPFLHAGEMVQRGDPSERRLSDWALEFECARGGLDEAAVFDSMRRILGIMRSGVEAGIAGTQYDDRVLGWQSGRLQKLMKSNALLDSDSLLNRMILYVTALMEAKSSMHVIVAAPTAGSCATFPGACLAAADALGSSEEQTLRAMLSAGLIGVFVATRSSFAAEVGGCQAETGAGAAMGAAALIELAGGHAGQALSAASQALQNVLGLICDPVANRVEAPCLGRNVTGAANALSCANMALAGYDHLIPLDEVLDAHREVSERMAREFRCTALGGLSITPTSKAIEANLCGGGGCASTECAPEVSGTPDEARSASTQRSPVGSETDEAHRAKQS